MTPREHAQAALRATNGNCLCDSTPSDLDTLEAAIRAAAEPLAAALREAEQALLGCEDAGIVRGQERGERAMKQVLGKARAALAAWEGK